MSASVDVQTARRCAAPAAVEAEKQVIAEKRRQLQAAKRAIEQHLEAIKTNAFAVADHHRKTCEGAECNISLSLLASLLERAGYKLTQEERRKFL